MLLPARTCVGIALALALVACGGGDDSGRAEPPTPIASPTLEPPPEGQGFQIDEGGFTVASGNEALYCKRYPIPASYGAEPVFVRGVDSLLPTGTHHFFMAYADGALDAPDPCVGDDPLVDLTDPEATHDAVKGKLVFTAAVGDRSYFLPDGYGVYLPTGLGHMSTSHHILNLTAETQTLYGVFNVWTAPLSQVPHPVNVVNCTLREIDVPPHTTATLSGTCTVPFDLDLVVLSSHAHQYLKKFEMRVRDDVVYESTTWDSPEIVPLDEPLRLTKGEGIEFSCTFENATDEPIVYGAGDHKEMCAIMSAYSYPSEVTGEIPPTLGGVVFTEGGTGPLVDTSELGGNF